MKLSKIIIIMLCFVTVISVSIILFSKNIFANLTPKEKITGTAISYALNNEVQKNNELVTAFANYSEEQLKIVYDGLTMEELAAKLDRILNDDLKGKGYLYASHSLEMGVDPYLAVAISLLETGCKWTCSRLVKECNNVGGQKGSPGCDGGSYKTYNTLDEGIIGFIDNIYYNYVAYDLLTPAQMSRKYAESTTWAPKVENYMEQIRKV